MKLPALHFYVGDWRKDIGVQSISYHDRGVWFELLCLMHESEQRGKLILKGKAVADDAIARLLGLDMQVCKRTIQSLLEAGVASRDDDTGALMSRRMVRDEQIRQTKVACGKKGGNPVLLNHQDNHHPPFLDNQSLKMKMKMEDGSPKEKGSGEKPRFAIPVNEQEAVEWCAAAGVPPDFAKQLFNQCAGTGFIDGVGRNITSWSHYAKHRHTQEIARAATGQSTLSKKPPTTFDIRTAIQNKEKEADAFKRKHYREHQGILGGQYVPAGWDNEQSKGDYSKLKAEIQSLKDKFNQQAA